MNDNCLVKRVYKELSVLQSCGFDTWCGRARELLQKYSILPNPNIKSHKQYVKSLIRNEYIKNWHENIQNHHKNPICRTYSLFKVKFQMENYLNCISDPKLRRSIVKFRMSSHALGVEKCRHKRSIGQENISNICLTCNVVEDEKHFILHCPRYSNEREHFLDKTHR